MVSSCPGSVTSSAVPSMTTGSVASSVLTTQRGPGRRDSSLPPLPPPRRGRAGGRGTGSSLLRPRRVQRDPDDDQGYSCDVGGGRDLPQDGEADHRRGRREQRQEEREGRSGQA